MLCSSPPLERARPLLGTIVAIRVRGAEEQAAHRAIGAAFEAITQIHRLMSFHGEDSDVSCLNRHAIEAPVSVDAKTYAVLSEALLLSEASEGYFDVAIGAALVARGLLPRPSHLRAPDPHASWRDIELCSDGSVRFHRPLWIDLGGIAKGYAVDSAIAALQGAGVEQACVNAGGDLRVLGDITEPVYLRTGGGQDTVWPLIMVADGSLASSGSLEEDFASPHIDPSTSLASSHRFAAVVAEHCLIADALTKTVLSRGVAAETLLKQYGARAFVYEQDEWISLGAPE